MNPKSYFVSLSPAARVSLIVGVLAIVALTAGMLWWLMAPRQQLLFGKLREADTAEIVQSLNEWKIPHQIIDGGTGITVAADSVYETRMRLLSAGVPRGGHVGFELFDDADFGVTEFAQRVNYQRALQGEIERTVASLPGVQTARVHLTIRRPGMFVGDRESSKASVAVAMNPGETLARPQVQGIRSLVASAVEGLAVADVSVLDSNGTLLAGGADGGRGAIALDERSDEEARLEDRIRLRVVELLGQVLNNEEFKVSVDASLNFDAVREVSERPIAQGDDGNGLLARKRINSSQAPDAAGRSQSQEESEYVHGMSREEISRAPGRVERLSVAVILPQHLDEQEVARIHSLVSAAAGIDTNRGDRLEVSRLPSGKVRATPPAVAALTAPQPADRAALAAPHRDLIANRSLQLQPWMPWALAGAVGLLLGAIFAFAAQRKPRKLSAEEREAVLAKLRGWLSEGQMPVEHRIVASKTP